MIYKYEDVDMIKAEMEITTYCNARCRLCPRTITETGEPQKWLVQEHMSFDTFKMIWSNKSNKIKHLKLCGQFGDPMMNPEVGKIVDHVLVDEDATMLINTNGGLRNTNWYKEMANKYDGQLEIRFGIDGLDHETNWKYREGVIFNKAFENMLSFHENGGDACWQFILFEWNQHQLEAAHALAKSLDLQQTFILDGEYRIHLEDRNDDHIITELIQRFENLGVTNYQGIK